MGICEFIAQATGEPAHHLCSTDSPHAATGNGHATVVGAIDFHSYGQLVLGGWAHTNQPTSDTLKNQYIGQHMVEAMKPQVCVCVCVCVCDVICTLHIPCSA